MRREPIPTGAVRGPADGELFELQVTHHFEGLVTVDGPACGDDRSDIVGFVTDDPALVTCPSCLLRLHEGR